MSDVDKRDDHVIFAFAMAQPWLSSAARELLDLLEPRAPAPTPSLADVVARLQRLGVADAIDLGFSFATPTDHTGYRVVDARPDGLPAGTFTLALSPERGHRAVEWHEHASDRLRLWIDAREIAVPSAADGGRLIEPSGSWFSERLFAEDIMMWDHPRQDRSRAPVVGTVFGLLVCDAETASQRLELPRDDETWTNPQLRVRETWVRLYADPAAFDADIPAREWELSAG